MGELAPPAASRFRKSQSTPVTPGSSSTSVHIASDQATLSPLSTATSPRTSSYMRPRSQSSNRLLSRPRTPALPAPDPAQRGFDALINYLPCGVSDKALLKQTILVTTISRPFLAASAPRPASYLTTSSLSRQTSRDRSQRRSIFGGLSIGSSRSSVYLPNVSPSTIHETGSVSSLSPPPFVAEGPAHLTHLLPPSFSKPPSRSHSSSRRKLIESIEAFLLSFAYPTPLSLENIKGFGMGIDMGAGMARARPYLMPAPAFGEPVSGVTIGSVADGHGGEWTVADVLFCGALDRADEPGALTGKAPAKARRHRAWVAGPADIVLVPAPTPSSLPETFLAPPAPAHIPGAPAPPEALALAPQPGAEGAVLQMPPRAQEKAKGRKLSRTFPGRAGQKQAYKAGATGLPTPPDSDEGSAVESEPVCEPPLVPVRVVGAEKGGPQTVEIVEKAGARKGRWRFWRVRTVRV
ncbi:hypothetical protein OBBRIDRAFT_205796 [Obba rivulosa]|uniref:Uncharacterized protein n=1 Tax=Obba rivulosa TaxID=1052685 RepID=A0A8E2AM55_9APHY|nr:hypothetical protein OBBRIDRAFT_205796 [Obba rivulosa]